VRDIGPVKRRAVEENKVSPAGKRRKDQAQSDQECVLGQSMTSEDGSRSNKDYMSQSSSLTQECNDLVMSLPLNEERDVKVLESVNICYCSNFDLNSNEWFNEYENIEIFKINMKKNLGKLLTSFTSTEINII
jgi:hypothetical protein